MSALLRLLMLTGHQRRVMVAAILLRMAEGIAATLPLAIVLWVAAVVIEPGHTLGKLLPALDTPPGMATIGGFLAAVYAVQWGLFHAASRSGHLAGYRLTARLRHDLIERLRDLPTDFFQGRDSGDIAGVIMGDVTRLELFPGIVLPRLVQALVFPMIGAVVALAVDWRLGLPLAISIVLLPFALIWGNSLQDAAARQLTAAGTELNSRVLEFVQAVPVLKSFGLTITHLSGCVASMRAARDCGKALILRYVLAAIAVPLLIASAGSITVSLAFVSMRAGDITTSSFLLFVFLTLRLFAPVIELVEFTSIIQQMTLSAERLTAILSAPLPTVPPASTPPQGRSIRFEAVSMTHEDGTPALRDVSFTVPEGTVTALVGQTGSGKTTAARLIARFWDASQGRVSIGDRDVRELDPDVMSDLVSVVSQNVVLFTMSVRDNIRLARPEARDDEIEAAARKARCHDLITGLPDGYDTVLDNGGAALSGGERQRVSLARLFLKDSPILVLDEATSSLDVENEHLVQQALADLIIGRTVVMIAHRLWTVRHADQIIVLDDGRLIQSGTHGELAGTEGLYRDLWDTLTNAPGWGRINNDNYLQIMRRQ